jgi:hypothetical protein
MPFPCRSPAALIHTYHVIPMPLPCRVNSHMPYRDSAILRQCRVLRESPRGTRKYPNCYSASGNLRGTPRGGRKKPNAVRSPTCRLWTAEANSHMPCRSHAALMPCCAVALRGRFQNGMVVAWQGNGMARVNQTRPHCVDQMGKTQSKLLAERHGRGTAWYVWISLYIASPVITWRCIMLRIIS